MTFWFWPFLFQKLLCYFCIHFRSGPANRKFSFESNHELNRLRFKSNLESNQDVIVYECNDGNDEQRCADSPGSSNNVARSLLQC